MKKLLVALFVIAAVCFFYDRDEPPATPPPPQEVIRAQVPSTYTGSRPWDSGHQAGYDWASLNGIDDEKACGEAGEGSNSQSFAEGCTAFVATTK